MAGNEDLRGFVQNALERGVPRPQVEDVLTKAGWAMPDVKGALAGFADLEFPLPVPRPKPYLSARDTFLYLLVFTTLYISAFNFGNLVFQYIDQAYPDPLSSAGALEYAERAIRWSVASVVVAFPIFLGMSWRIGREVAARSSKRPSMVKRWLTYLTLFVASSVIIGDLTVLVNGALVGELTVRFLLKVLTVGTIAGTTFWYYLSDLRADEREVEP
jgi:hypothetical protein